MGNTWAVSIWVKNEYLNDGSYHSARYYSGESFWEAVYYFFKARETGSGCISLEYRGNNKKVK